MASPDNPEPTRIPAPPGVTATPSGPMPGPWLSYDSKDYPRLVFSAPRFEVIAIADIIQPSVLEAVQGMLPSLVPPYVTQAAQDAVNALAVRRVGDTMTGALMLSPTIPTAPTMAASKQYVDTQVATAVPEVPAVPAGQSWARQTGQWVALSGGGTITGVTAGSGLSGGGVPGTVTISIQNQGVTNAMLNLAPASTLKGNGTGSSASPTDLSATQVMAMLNAAPINSPVFTGSPSMPTGSFGVTQAPGNSSTALATTAFVGAAISAGLGSGVVNSFNTRTGAVTLALADVTGAGGAPINAPNFTGIPTASSAAVDTNSSQLATCQFVLAQASAQLPLVNGTAAVGSTTRYARADHVHPTDLSRTKVTISDTAPVTPTPLPGDFWLDSVGVQTYIFYNDGSSSQWISVNNIQGVGSYLALSGGTMTGPLTLAADPAAALQAATRRYVDSSSSRPNKLLNPFMEIDQANEGNAVVVTGAGKYAIDGFAATYVTSAGGAGQAARNASGPQGGYGVTVQTLTAASSVGASDYMWIDQALEADDINDTYFGTANAQPLTCSFWAFSTIAGTLSFVLKNPVSPYRTYAVPFTITTANTWQFFTITVPGDTGGTWTIRGNGQGMLVGWTGACGATLQTAPNAWTTGNFLAATGAVTNTLMTTSGAYFVIGPCKLEVGSTATPMLRQSFQQELARCQRYYEKSYAPGVAVGAASISDGNTLAYWASGSVTAASGGASIPFKATKRSPATITMYSPTTGASGRVRDIQTGADVTPSVGAGTNSFYWSATQTTGANIVNLQGCWVADARL